MATSFSIRVSCPECGRTSAVLMRRTGTTLRLFCPGCRNTWEQPAEHVRSQPATPPAPARSRGTERPPRKRR